MPAGMTALSPKADVNPDLATSPWCQKPFPCYSSLQPREAREVAARMCRRSRETGKNEPTTVREAKRGNDRARSGDGQTSKDAERARGHAARGAAREARCDRRRLQHPCLSNKGGAPRLGCRAPWRETCRRRRCQRYLCKHHTRSAEAVRIGRLTAAGREPSSHLARVLSVSATARQHLDQPIQIFLAVEERPHQHAFVPAVYAHIVDIASQPGMAISRYPGIAQIAAVGRAGAHGGDDRRARPELGRELRDYTHNLPMERGRGAQDRLAHLRHGNLIVGENPNQRRLDVIDRL